MGTIVCMTAWSNVLSAAQVFMNKEVHKEHLDQLESRLHTVSQNVEKWGEEASWQRLDLLVDLSCSCAQSGLNLLSVFKPGHNNV